MAQPGFAIRTPFARLRVLLQCCLICRGLSCQGETVQSPLVNVLVRAQDTVSLLSHLFSGSQVQFSTLSCIRLEAYLKLS
jgi:hypothetical protein